MKSNNDKPRIVPLPVIVLVSALLTFVLVAFSDSQGDLLSAIALRYAVSFWSFIWFVRFAVSWVRRHRCLIPPQPWRRALLYWGIEPTALVLSVLLAHTGILRPFRFHLCRSWLDNYVSEVVAGRVQPHGFGTHKHWIGLFRIAETELLPDCQRSVKTSHGLSN